MNRCKAVEDDSDSYVIIHLPPTPLFMICDLYLLFIQSAKVYKRHSSVITSAQHVEEVKEMKTRDDRAQTPG